MEDQEGFPRNSNKHKQFLKIVEAKTKKADENYFVLLSCWIEKLEMPTSRGSAVQRLMYLKARFKRNPSFFVDYQKFMNDVNSKGYARNFMQDIS